MDEQQSELGFKRKKRNFTQVDNEIVNNAELSLQAKGLMLYLLSKKEGWKFYETDIEKRSSNGKASVRAIIKELLDAGYLERGERLRTEKGYLGGYIYSVVDYQVDDYDGKSYIRFSKVGLSKVGNSKVGLSKVGNSKVGLSKVGKSDTSNTKGSSNTESLSNTNKTSNTKQQQEMTSLSLNSFKFYESNIGPLNPFTAELIDQLIDEHTEELVLAALQITVKSNKSNIKYTESILRNWHKDNIKTLHDLETRNERNEKYGKGRFVAPAEYDDGVNF